MWFWHIINMTFAMVAVICHPDPPSRKDSLSLTPTAAALQLCQGLAQLQAASSKVTSLPSSLHPLKDGGGDIKGQGRGKQCWWILLVAPLPWDWPNLSYSCTVGHLSLTLLLSLSSFHEGFLSRAPLREYSTHRTPRHHALPRGSTTFQNKMVILFLYGKNT